MYFSGNYEMGVKEIDARTNFSGKFELGFGGVSVRLSGLLIKLD